MKNTLYTILLLLSTINIASAADTPEAMASAHYERALLHVPQGANIRKIILTRTTLSWGTQPVYIKFDFEGQCYLAYVAYERFALTAIPCE